MEQVDPSLAKVKGQWAEASRSELFEKFSSQTTAEEEAERLEENQRRAWEKRPGDVFDAKLEKWKARMEADKASM